MLDLLDHGCDGEPRCVVLDAADTEAAAQLVRVITAEAERRGYVPVAAERFTALARALPEEARHRTFALVSTCAAGTKPDLSSLMAAAAVNARPHVLVAVAVARRPFRGPAVLREARTAYAAAPIRSPAPAWSPEAQKYVTRAGQAFALARTGRHEPAVRMLREAVAALARRREAIAAAHAGLLLGRVLLERGQADAAAAVFAEVVGYLDPVDAPGAGTARVWTALARTDAGRFTEAEGLLRATMLARVLPDEASMRWAEAALARCLRWQDRHGEAGELVAGASDVGADADPALAVPILATRAKVRAAQGELFQAGQLARAALETAERSGDAVLQLSAGIAHLRVLAAAGDLTLASERKEALLVRARRHHVPLHALRIRLLWAGMLRKAGRRTDAARELAVCARLSKAAPTLLRRRVHLMVNEAAAPPPPAVAQAGHGAFAMTLLRVAQEEDDDQAAVQKALGKTCEQMRAGRVEVQSAAAGALATIASAGTGLPSRLGQRALEAGIGIGPEQRDGVWQAAAPVRSGHRLLGVITCRWPLGRDACGAARDLLELTAAAVAPRVDALLAGRAAAAQATTAVPELLGVSEAIAELRRAIARAATAPFSVLVEGESGVGKELVARAVHHLSPRRDRRFCDINCAALPDDLVESELFGHAKGAFTGALVERRGLFEEATGGTLFLDELPDLSLRSQAKLLRVLQQGEIRRVGESFARHVDVRIVAATNRTLAAEVAAGRFRQDLLYRLDVIRMTVPPLRQRPEDIPVLAGHFWTPAAERAGTRASLSHGVLAELARYHWPGNVRELQNVIAALAVAAPARGLVRPTLLPQAITGSISVASARLLDARRQFERRFIEVALARAGGSRTRAAAQLGVSRQGLLKLMARLGIAGAEKPEADGGE